MKYTKLFSSYPIGKLNIKNRIVMPAMGTSLALASGEASDEIIKYYEERAKGGCGLIITEITRIDNETGIGTPCQLNVTDLKYIPRLEKLARAIHRYDSKIFVQLHHPGLENHGNLIGGKQIVGPSAVMSNAIGEMPRALEEREVEELVKKFVFGAYVAKTAGIDGVEVHAAHGYLVGSFLSPHTNKRTDKYGGSFEGRVRFLAEIVMGIKQTCGKDFPVSVRLDGDEFTPDGFKLEEAIKTATYLEKIGVDVINVSSGTYETVNTIIEPVSYPQGWKKHLAAAIKKAVSIPVIACDVIRKPDFAESLLEEGNLDFVAIGRGQLADPEWALKAKEDRAAEIRQCISCRECIKGILECKVIRCSVNARCGRETEFTELKKDGFGRKVVIVGGGPAGLEAARVLALREFKPILFEKENNLGGSAHLAGVPPLKEKVNWFMDGLIEKVKGLDVEIHLGKAPSLEEIKSIQPYAVFVATGGTSVVPNLPDIHEEQVCTAADILKKDILLENKQVVVVGSGMTGLETAELLVSQNNKVTIIEMAPQLAPGSYLPNMIDIVMRLKKHEVVFVPGTKLLEVGKGFVKVESTVKPELEKLPAEAVVLSVGVKNNPAYNEEIKNSFEKVKILGDAFKVGKIVDAVQTGFESAYFLK